MRDGMSAVFVIKKIVEVDSRRRMWKLLTAELRNAERRTLLPFLV